MVSRINCRVHIKQVRTEVLYTGGSYVAWAGLRLDTTGVLSLVPAEDKLT